MALGYKISDGTDIEEIFQPHAGGTTQVTGYQDSSGTDLGSLLMAYVDGSGSQTASATGYKNSSGTDFNQLFAVLGDIMAVQSVQRGSYTLNSMGGAIQDITISSVDLNKSLVFITFSTTSFSPALEDCFAKAQLTSNTNIELQYGANGNNLFVEWQVVEFE